MKILRLLLISLIFVILVSCQAPNEALRIVIIPAGDAISTLEDSQLFLTYMQEQLDMDVELIIATDYAAVTEAMKYNHADIARYGPSSYILAAQEANIEPVVVGIKKKTGVPGYWAYIISRPGLETLEGATFAFVDPGSTSGYVYPNQYIETEGITLDKVMFAGSHPAVIEAIKNGSVDAGGIASNRWEFALNEGVISEGQLEIFWSSDLIPASPWVVQTDMAPELKAAFTEAMLSMPEEIAYSRGVEETGFVLAYDSDYDIVRAIETK